MKSILLLILLSTFLFSIDNAKKKIKNKYSSLESTLNSIEHKLKIVHKKLNSASKSIDEFITNEYTNDIYKDSYIQIETSLKKISGSDMELESDVDIRIRSPKLKEKLSITIDNRDDKISSGYQDSNENIDTNDNDYNIGLLYRTIKRKADLKFRVRLKMSNNPYIYAKAEAKRMFELNNKSNILIKQKLKYSHKNKLDSYSSFRYNYKLNNMYLFSNYNQYHINSDEKHDNIYNSIRLNQKLNNLNYINYVSSINSNDNESNFQAKEYKTYISYRKYIRKWLYYDIVPSITWTRSNNFNNQAGIRFNVGLLIKE
jgi:hypothetical protein